MPMKTLPFFVCMIIAIISDGCEKNPIDSKEIIQNPRQYKWTVDTLAYPGSFQTSMRDMWGSSSKDVYVVGHNFLNRGLMYHFDGKAWGEVPQYHPDTQGNSAIDLSAVYGFSTNDIWAVGERIYTNPNRPPNFLDSSLVIHYDGSNWTEAKNLRKRRLMSVWGTSFSNLFVGGHEGVIMHYDGLRWTTQSVSPPAQLLYIGGDANRLFAGGGVTAGSLDTLMAFTNSGHGWQLLDRQFISDYYQSPRFGSSDFYSPASGVYYSVGWGIFHWQGARWEMAQRTETFLNDIFGTNSSNIFAIGQFGKAYHWNGNDWALLTLPFDKIPSDIWLTGVWTDGKEAFICGFGNGRGGVQVTFILHGK